MKLLLAGASGVIGRALTPMLLDAGYQVVAIARRPEAEQQPHPLLRWYGLDVYDRDRLFALMEQERPEIVMHQLTDLKGQNSEDNAKLRRAGTRNLVDAALAAGVGSIVGQSISWVYVAGDDAATEATPLDRDAAASRRVTMDGIVAHEEALAEIAHHVTLRYGTLYGQGTWYARDGAFADRVRSGQLGAIPAITNFLHVEDAAQAALEAIRWPSGVVNIVDGDPAAAGEWLSLYAKELGVTLPAIKAPQPDPSRPVSNTLARELGWKPRHKSWKNGFF